MSCPSSSLCRSWGRLVLPTALALICGCGPNRANVELRKQIQALEDRVSQLQRDLRAARAEVEGLRSGGGPTTQPLDSMFTVHEIRLGRLTGPVDPADGDPRTVKVYLSPLDETGAAIKATGRVTVEVFDLQSPARLAAWSFQPAQLKQRWYSLGPLQAFVLECRWSGELPDRPVLLRVQFEDALTQRVFSAVREIRFAAPQAVGTQEAAVPLTP